MPPKGKRREEIRFGVWSSFVAHWRRPPREACPSHPILEVDTIGVKSVAREYREEIRAKSAESGVAVFIYRS
jgi:hypothetical protein